MVLSDVTIACCNHNNNHPMARGWCHVIEASDFPCSLSWRGPSLSWLQNLREAGGRHSAHDHCAVHIDKLCSFNFLVTRSVRICFNYQLYAYFLICHINVCHSNCTFWFISMCPELVVHVSIIMLTWQLRHQRKIATFQMIVDPFTVSCH